MKMNNTVGRAPSPKLISVYLILLFGGIISFFPFYWMIISAFKHKEDLFKFPPDLIPLNPTLENFRFLLTETDFARNMINSLVVAVGFTVLSVFLTSLGGYAFAKIAFPGRRLLFGFVIATMILPFEIALVPLFLIMARINWLNTYQAVILPFSASAWGIFLMRQALSDFPSEMLDAARIDGASEFQIFYKIVVPISKPALGALATIMFLQSWNDYLWPLIALSDNRMTTAPVALATFRNAIYADYASMAAGSLISALPLMILFLFFQRYFIQGALFGSLKG
jgi:lactose/L-arabinose transport system permease protein